MNLHEEIVLGYLTRYPSGTFVCPQFSFHDASISGGVASRPDFVGLNLLKKVVFVVEVSASRTPRKIRELKEKVIDHKERWYESLRMDLESVIGKDWAYEVRVFVWQEMTSIFDSIINAPQSDVIVKALEDVFSETGEQDKPEKALDAAFTARAKSDLS
jgi:hypothetical protein